MLSAYNSAIILTTQILGEISMALTKSVCESGFTRNPNPVWNRPDYRPILLRDEHGICEEICPGIKSRESRRPWTDQGGRWVKKYGQTMPGKITSTGRLRIKNTKTDQPAHPRYLAKRLYAEDRKTRTPLRRPTGRIQPPHQRKRPARLPYGRRAALHRPLQRPLWR